MKALVQYIPSVDDFIEVGKGGCVYPINHPSSWVSNTSLCYTSTIVRKEANGEFETLNTIYKPVLDKPDKCVVY
jgi:hypothetical protein